MSSLKPEIIQRLVLAKLLFKQGESYCSSNDRIRFSIGLLSFHDAIENCLGALADSCHAKVKERMNFMDYFDLIDKKVTKINLPYKLQINNLNRIRVDIKHYGIIPDPKQNLHFTTTIKSFFKEVCLSYFNINFETLSLKDSIIDDDIRNLVGKIEEEIELGQYKNALENMAVVMFKIFEKDILSKQRLVKLLQDSQYKQKKQDSFSEIFPEFDYVKDKLDLIEKGVDPIAYRNFKYITPDVGLEESTEKIVIRWGKQFGHKANWTKENTIFCYDFLIDAILKFQGLEYSGLKIIDYQKINIDSIESLINEANFFDKIENYEESFLESNSKQPKILFSLKKGKKIYGWAYLDENRKYFTVYSEDIVNYGYGYVRKSDVKVTKMLWEEYFKIKNKH